MGVGSWKIGREKTEGTEGTKDRISELGDKEAGDLVRLVIPARSSIFNIRSHRGFYFCSFLRWVLAMRPEMSFPVVIAFVLAKGTISKR